MAGKRRSGLSNHRRAYRCDVNCNSSSSSTPVAPTTYTVTYLGNTNTSGTPPVDASSPYTGGSSVTVLGNSGTLTKTVSGTIYQFAGWNTQPDGSGTNYVGGNTFTINANTTLYTNWIIGGTRLVYNANSGGSGTAPPSSGTYYTAFSTQPVVDNTFTNTNGYTFSGWNTLANGTGISYPAGSNIIMPGAGVVQLYAQWIDTSLPQVTLTYNAGTGGSGSPPIGSPTSYFLNTTATISENTGSYTNGSLVFYGWNTAANGTGTSYQAGSTRTMTANTILYAQWVSNTSTYTVTYDANGATGGSVPAAPTNYPSGVQVPILGQGSLTRPGYAFLGWNGSSTGAGSVYAPGYTFTSKTATLYAQWAPGSTVRNCGGGTGSNTYIFYNYPFAQIVRGTDIITIYTTCIVGSTSSNVGSGAAPEGLISITSKMVITSATITINTNTTYLNSANDYNYAYTITNGTGVTYWPTTPSVATISSVTFPFTSPLPVNSAAGAPTYGVSTRNCVNGCGLSGTGSGSGSTFTSFNFFNQGVTLNYSNGTNTIFVSSPNNSVRTTTSGSTWIQTPNSLYPYNYIQPSYSTTNTLTPRSSAALTTITIIPSTASEYIYPPMPDYTVQYDGNGATGGSIPIPQYFAPYNTDVGAPTFPYTVVGNTGSLTKSTAPSTFSKWNTQANGLGTDYGPGTANLTYAGGASLILYAQWV